MWVPSVSGWSMLLQHVARQDILVSDFIGFAGVKKLCGCLDVTGRSTSGSMCIVMIGCSLSDR